MIKKTNTIFFSPTGTTAKITKQISAGLDYQTKAFDLTLPEKRNQCKELIFNHDDLVIVGVPVYSGRIPGFLTEYFREIKGKNTPAVFIVVYGNREYDDALLELKNIFEQKGFIGIAAGAFVGEHSFTAKLAGDRPDAEDINLALQFGQKIRAKLNNSTDIKNQQLNLKGNFPYKKRGKASIMIPQTNDKCTDCGICAENCPMNAIDFENVRVIDAEKCILCNSCVKKCPENAKKFTDKIFLTITQRLIDNFSSTRKEPELFL